MRERGLFCRSCHDLEMGAEVHAGDQPSDAPVPEVDEHVLPSG